MALTLLGLPRPVPTELQEPTAEVLRALLRYRAEDSAEDPLVEMLGPVSEDWGAIVAAAVLDLRPELVQSHADLRRIARSIVTDSAESIASRLLSSLPALSTRSGKAATRDASAAPPADSAASVPSSSPSGAAAATTASTPQPLPTPVAAVASASVSADKPSALYRFADRDDLPCALDLADPPIVAAAGVPPLASRPAHFNKTAEFLASCVDDDVWWEAQAAAAEAARRGSVVTTADGVVIQQAAFAGRPRDGIA